jgi:hypothetical protein
MIDKRYEYAVVFEISPRYTPVSWLLRELCPQLSWERQAYLGICKESDKTWYCITYYLRVQVHNNKLMNEEHNINLRTYLSLLVTMLSGYGKCVVSKIQLWLYMYILTII